MHLEMNIFWLIESLALPGHLPPAPVAGSHNARLALITDNVRLSQTAHFHSYNGSRNFATLLKS
jgi:hypothetical protein